MKKYTFANIEVRPILSLEEVNNEEVFADTKHYISVSSSYYPDAKDAMISRRVTYDTFPYGTEYEKVLMAARKIGQYFTDLGHIIVAGDSCNVRAYTIVELFYYLSSNKHYTDEYKGYQNHLLYEIGEGMIDEKILEEPLIQDKYERIDEITAYHHDIDLVQVTKADGSIYFLRTDFNSDDCIPGSEEKQPYEASTVLEAIYKFLLAKKTHYCRPLEDIVKNELKHIREEREWKIKCDRQHLKDHLASLPVYTLGHEKNVENMKGVINKDFMWLYYDGNGNTQELGEDKDEAIRKFINEEYITEDEPFFVQEDPIMVYTSYNQTKQDIIEEAKKRIATHVNSAWIDCIKYHTFWDDYSSYDYLCYLQKYYDLYDVADELDIGSVVKDIVESCYHNSSSKLVIDLFADKKLEGTERKTHLCKFCLKQIDDAISDELMELLRHDMNKRADELIEIIGKIKI